MVKIVMSMYEHLDDHSGRSSYTKHITQPFNSSFKYSAGQVLGSGSTSSSRMISQEVALRLFPPVRIPV